MSKTHKNLVAVGIILTVSAVTFHKSMQSQLIDAYPDLDPKLVRKAYNQMTRDALRGKFAGNTITDAFLDNQFMTNYMNLNEA